MMDFLLTKEQVQNKNKEEVQQNDTSSMALVLYNTFTEASEGAGKDELYSEGPLFDFINKRTSKINIMTKPFHIMSDIEYYAGSKGAANYFDELGYACQDAERNVFGGYVSDKIRYILLDLMGIVAKQVVYEFDWIDENYIYESFRERSEDMYHWSFRLINTSIMQLLNRAHHDHFGEDDPNYENNILIMAAPMIEYTSISITTTVADIIFHTLYNILFAIADGETYRIACDTLSEIIIGFKNGVSKMISGVIVETVNHRGSISFSYEEELKEMKEYFKEARADKTPSIHDFDETAIR